MTNKNSDEIVVTITDDFALVQSSAPSVSAPKTTEDILQGEIDTNIYHGPWDSPEALAQRVRDSFGLAEYLGDIDCQGRAAVYSRLGDKRLHHLHQESYELKVATRQSTFLGTCSIMAGGISSSWGLAMGFNSATLIAGGVSTAGLAVAVCTGLLSFKNRERLIKQVDAEIKEKGIRLPLISRKSVVDPIQP